MVSPAALAMPTSTFTTFSALGTAGIRGLEVEERKCAVHFSLESNFISEHSPRKTDPGPMAESPW